MHTDTWKISGKSFHFGVHGFGQEETAGFMPSDSLFAALISRMVLQQGQEALDDFIQPFLVGQPPFVLTSTFPFAAEVRFFPIPANAIHRSGDQEVENARPKELKKVKWVSETLFRRLLAGESLASYYPDAHKLQGKEILVAAEDLQGLPEALQMEGSPLWDISRRPRVALGRAAQNSNLFFTGQLVFAEECGLWFGVRWLVEEPKLKSLLSGLLADLAEAGLGAERSIGFGGCTIQSGRPVDLPDAGGQAWVTLSRYLPRPEEIDGLRTANACYTIHKIGGWVDSTTRRGQRRRAVHLLQEGSVIGPVRKLTDQNGVPGQIVDVHPSYKAEHNPLGHAVYRSGLAFAVGLTAGPAPLVLNKAEVQP